MEIIYDYKAGEYHIILKEETEFCFNTDNIFQTREWFIEQMTRMFDDTVGVKFTVFYRASDLCQNFHLLFSTILVCPNSRK